MLVMSHKEFKKLMQYLVNAWLVKYISLSALTTMCIGTGNSAGSQSAAVTQQVDV